MIVFYKCLACNNVYFRHHSSLDMRAQGPFQEYRGVLECCEDVANADRENNRFRRDQEISFPLPPEIASTNIPRFTNAITETRANPPLANLNETRNEESPSINLQESSSFHPADLLFIHPDNNFIRSLMESRSESFRRRALRNLREYLLGGCGFLSSDDPADRLFRHPDNNFIRSLIESRSESFRRRALRNLREYLLGDVRGFLSRNPEERPLGNPAAIRRRRRHISS